ncbi:MAG: two-component system sensor histidine kinase NtrB, partial [Polyangiaceae bacterium]
LIDLPLEKLLGKSQYDFCSPEEADLYNRTDVIMFAARDGGPRTDELTFHNDAFPRRSFVTTKMPIMDDEGNVTHLVAIIHDMTAHRAAQEAMKLDLMRKERLTELGQLAGGVAHEIRNPLSAINSAAYVLARHFGKEAPEDMREALAIVHEEVRRANHIVSDLLDYARVREPDRKHTSISLLVESAVKAADLPKSVELVGADIDPQLTAFVDVTQCEAALANVIRNSGEAMQGKGKVHVDVTSDDATVTVRVRDEGPGVSAEIESRLFEPLVTTKPAGLGLGLVTARRLVEGHGGTLVFERDGGTGACFAMTFPRSA